MANDLPKKKASNLSGQNRAMPLRFAMRFESHTPTSLALRQGPPNEGVSNRGVSRSGLVLPFCPFLSCLGTFPIFPGFSRFARGWSGDFPDSPLFSFSAYREHLKGTVPKGSAAQSGPFPKKGVGTGVSRRVWRTTWERSLKNWELQIPCFEEFFWGGNTLGLVLPSLLALWDTPVLFTPPLPLPQKPPGLETPRLSFSQLIIRNIRGFC